MTDKINDGGPAFPVISDAIGHNAGMSLRDAAALAALPYLQSAAMHAIKSGSVPLSDAARTVAEAAYEQADALLVARVKGGMK